MFIFNKFNKFFLDSPVDWQCSFQNPATPVMEGIIWLHNYIMFFLIIVVVVVFWFLCRSMYLFRSKQQFNYNSEDFAFSNEEAMEFNHDPVIETIWTIAPAFILISIAIPSFSLLYSMDEVINPTITLKIIGHQWYWSYEFDNIFRVDHVFDYAILSDDKAKWFNVLYCRTKEANQKFNKVFSLAKSLLEPKSKTLVKLFYFRYFLMKYIVMAPDPSGRLFKPVYHLWTMARFSIYPKFHPLLSDIFGPITHFKSMMPLNKEKINTLNQVIVTQFSIFSSICFEGRTLRSIDLVIGGVHFDSYMINSNDLISGGLRLLEVDNRLILPTSTNIRLLVTSADVIHSWAVPSFGIKIDAIPGRLNQVPLYIKREGFFYGQCSELCGVNHGFMPISVQAVDYNTFVKWIRLNTNPKSLNDLLATNWSVKINN